MAAFDFIRRGAGLATERERQIVREEISAITRQNTPSARLAMTFADMVTGQGGQRPTTDGMIRIMVPELAHDARPLPKDVDHRRLVIAKAVMKTVDRHLEHGSDSHLGPDIGRAVRTEAVRNLHAVSIMSGSLERTLERRSDQHGKEVAAYLAYGDAVERQHQAHVKAIPSKGELPRTIERIRANGIGREVPAGGQELADWVDKGLRTERAMARSGMMPPENIVKAAHSVMRNAPVETLSREPRARPDFSRPIPVDISQRRSEIAQWHTAPGRTTPIAAMDRTETERATQTASPQKGVTIQAALATSRSNAM